MSWLSRLERISLGLVWVMLIVVFINFDHFPVVIHHGQYFVKNLGYVTLQRATPYLLMEYGFFFVAGLYVAVLLLQRIRRTKAARRAEGEAP